MTLKTIFRLCRKLCLKQNPNSGYKVNGVKVSYTDLAEELKKLQDWCYPLDTQHLKIQVRCCECEHYKKFKHVESKRDRRTVMMCELDKKPKQKDHYCGYALLKKTLGQIEEADERIEDDEQSQ